MKNKIYTITEIMKVLPHRFPFLLIDKVEVIEDGIKGIGYKNVTIDEPFFQGHFPSNPIMPGVLQIEAMAQTAGIIICAQKGDLSPKQVLFMSVDKAKFRKPVIPGDKLEIHAEKIKQHKNIVLCTVQSFVDGNLVSQAELTALINP